MSEVQKPVEEPVAAPTTETPVVSEPVAAAKPVEETPAPVETATEIPAAAEPAPAVTEEVAAPVKKEPKPIEEGTLGYKGPGLIKSFIFQKKHFWFGTEPVESKHLSNYLRGEKPDPGNHNTAWASHTGKGLLFFSKKPSEKATPAGVINLSEASDVTNEGTSEFYFNILSHKHTFQATTIGERDNWVSFLKTKIAEAKELKDSVTGSETYKKTHSSLNKPVFAATAASVPKKPLEVKKEEKVEAKEESKEEKKEVKEEKKEEKKARQSRSASRKRNSIFGSIGFAKKEEKVEPKGEAPAAVAPEEAAAPVESVEPVTASAPVEETPAPAVTEPAVTEPVATEPAVTEPAALVEESKPVETKPAPTKRNSIFGSLQAKFNPKEKKTEEAAPAVPPKDAEPVAESAPVIPAVEATEPLATSVASPATVPIETVEAPVTNGETKTETTAVRSDKRKSSLPWLSKKEKATTSDEETEKTEKPLSPFAKLRATVKSKTSAPKTTEKTTEKPTEELAEPTKEAATPATTEATPIATEPIVSEPIAVAPASTPQVSATA